MYFLIGFIYCIINIWFRKLDNDGDYLIIMVWFLLWPICFIALFIQLLINLIEATQWDARL